MKPVLVALSPTPDSSDADAGGALRQPAGPAGAPADLPAPETGRVPRSAPGRRSHPARARILDDARLGARAYVVSFVIPSDGE